MCIRDSVTTSVMSNELASERVKEVNLAILSVISMLLVRLLVNEISLVVASVKSSELGVSTTLVKIV